MSAIGVFLQLGSCVVVIVTVVAVLVYWLRVHWLGTSADTHPGRGGDAVFWNCFLAMALLLPCVLIPAIYSPVVGAALAFLAAAAAVAAYLVTPSVDNLRRQRLSRRAAKRSFSPSTARHEAALARWSSYELDVGNLIDYPAMTDVRQPETAQLVRAMREASMHRSAGDPDYVVAVGRLELALAAAERGAGVPADLACSLPEAG